MLAVKGHKGPNYKNLSSPTLPMICCNDSAQKYYTFRSSPSFKIILKLVVEPLLVIVQYC